MGIERSYFVPHLKSWLWVPPRIPVLGDPAHHMLLKMALIEKRVNIDPFPAWWAGTMKHAAEEFTAAALNGGIHGKHVHPFIRLYENFLDIFEELHRKNVGDIRGKPPSEPLRYMGAEGFVHWAVALHPHLECADTEHLAKIMRALGTLQKFGALETEGGVPKDESGAYASHILGILNIRLLHALDTGHGGSKPNFKVDAVASVAGALNRLQHDGFPIARDELQKFTEALPAYLEARLGSSGNMNESNCRVFLRFYETQRLPLRPGSALHRNAVRLAREESGKRRPIAEALQALCA